MSLKPNQLFPCTCGDKCICDEQNHCGCFSSIGCLCPATNRINPDLKCCSDVSRRGYRESTDEQGKTIYILQTDKVVQPIKITETTVPVLLTRENIENPDPKNVDKVGTLPITGDKYP